MPLKNIWKEKMFLTWSKTIPAAYPTKEENLIYLKKKTYFLEKKHFELLLPPMIQIKKNTKRTKKHFRKEG